MADFTTSPLGPFSSPAVPGSSVGFIRFLNGNPELPGSFGGPAEVEARINLRLLTTPVGSLDVFIELTGHESKREFTAPEPAAAGLVALAALARRRACL
jgi:hypothetical protein